MHQRYYYVHTNPDTYPPTLGWRVGDSPGPSLERLDPPRQPSTPWTLLHPLKSWTFLDLPGLFGLDRVLRQQGQRSWLRAFMLCTSFPKISHAPRPCLDPSSTRFADCSGSVPLFMPDLRLMSALMLWTSFITLRKGHVDSRKVFS